MALLSPFVALLSPFGRTQKPGSVLHAWPTKSAGTPILTSSTPSDPTEQSLSTRRSERKEEFVKPVGKKEMNHNVEM